MMNDSNSYINVKNKVKQTAEEKYKTDYDKQKDISNSDNNQNNDINSEDTQKINENYNIKK